MNRYTAQFYITFLCRVSPWGTRLGVDVVQRKFISNIVKHNTVKYAWIQAPSSRRLPLEGQTPKTEA